MPTPNISPSINPDEGQIIISDSGTVIEGLPIIDDTTQQQIDEIDSGIVVGHDEHDTYTPIDTIPLEPEEPVYRKRLVKIVNGKIVAERIVYMKRYSVAASGGYGDGYVFLLPNYDPLAGTITFTPAQFLLD